MKNNISLFRAILVNILLVIVVVFISFLLNYFIPLNFSGYFVLCAISLLLCIKLLYGKRSQDLNRKAFILPWALTLIASVLITINYLRPKEARVYSNVDTQVLALKGLCVKDSLNLIDSDKKNALFDKSTYEGRMIVKPTDSAHCLLTFDVIKSTIATTFNNYQEYITENELIELLEKFVNFYKSLRLLHLIR